MANPHRGEVALKSGGKVYTLLFDINTICEIEEALDVPLSELGETLLESAKLSTIRTMVWAGLQHHHPTVDLKAAGLIIAGADLADVSKAIGEGLVAALPKAEGGASTPGPRKAETKKARPGTGKRS
jgi:hypothetical protein